MAGFQNLGVAKWLDEALAAMKIITPTAIQEASIPKILQGHDFIGGAKTGSGKTVAFGAPILTKWSEDPCGIFGLILTPTRELAMQIAEQFSALGASMNIKVSIIVGGEDIVKQALELQRRPHFVIATPGRLADHIMNSGEDTIRGLRRVKYLVLDEADRLLSDSFQKDMKRCYDILPTNRQTLVFTATVDDNVRNLREELGANNKPEVIVHEIENIDNVAIPKTLDISYVFIPMHVKESYLHSIVTHPDNENKSIIVFVNRTYTAELIRRTLRHLDQRVTSLHSEMQQTERVNSLHRFKAEAARILVATDLVSRGLDIPTVQLVINYDMPQDPADYIHRVGRTARAGRKGESISFVTDRDVEKVLRIEERIGKKMDKYEKVSDNRVINNSLTKTTKAKRESMMEMESEGFGEKRKINRRKRERSGGNNQHKVSKPKNKKSTKTAN
ncbi:ATP-dependent RNA helicase [Saccharomycopsis crataegensis]|uniref:RNA helicase n=1 Tax=Saccharomycopsis crataegensis TaxID=43959 RepID=A0AAV5QH64_9ASCO|nr:ATP-dependent RNA helicase [Saccharomycopsis crataegensis]